MALIQTIICLVFFFATAASHGQTIVEELPPQTATELAEGDRWPLGLTLGSSFSSYQDVVGQPDGTTNLYSLDLDTSWLRRRSLDDWSVQLKISEIFTRTPVIHHTIKSEDELRLEGLYWRRFSPSSPFALYGRLAINAPLFAGHDVRAEDRTYEITYLDQRQETIVTDRLKLTDGLKPTTIKEGLGLSFRNQSAMNLETRVGLGGRQTLAAGQLHVTKAPKELDQAITVAELQDTKQIGSELFLGIAGELRPLRMSYKLQGEAFSPFSYQPKDDDSKSFSALTSHELMAKLDFHLSEWSALVYQFKNRKEPLLKDKAQLSHSVMLTISFKSDDLLGSNNAADQES